MAATNVGSDKEVSLNEVYDEDVVQSKDKKKIGIVIKTSRNDNSDSDDSDAESEENEKVDHGKVMVGWYSLNSKWNDEDEVKIVDEKTIKLVDRSLLHGDVIRWTDKSKVSQKGQIQEVDVYVDLKIVGTSHILKNINSKRLLPLEKYVSFLPVVKSPWMGAIQNVKVKLTLSLKNGTKCVISGSSVDSLEDTTDQRDEESTFYCDDFYPGQQVRGPANIFKEAKWIVGSRPAISNHGRIKAVVEDVSVESIDVDWQVCGYTGNSDLSVIQPPTTTSKKDLGELKILNHFKEAHIQIGDKAYYTLTEDDIIFCKSNSKSKKPKEKEDDGKQSTASANVDHEELSEEDDDSDYDIQPTLIRTGSNTPAAAGNRRGASRPRRRRHAQVPKRKKRYQPPVALKQGERVCVEVCFTKTFANTLWQDGSIATNVNSIDLHPVIHLDELEFFPGDYVIDKREDLKTTDRFGVIQTADFDARLCSIRWLSFINNNTETTEELENDVSVYDIGDHKDYAFRTGDIVVRLASSNDDTKQESTNDISPAGEVIKVNLDGTVQVLWVDSTISAILPSQLYVLSKDDDDMMNWNDVEGSDDGLQSSNEEEEWETASDSSDVMSPEDLQNQLNPLEDVIMRSLAALTPRNNEDNTAHSPSVIARDQRTVNYINALERQFSPNNSTSETPSSGEGNSKPVEGQQEVNMSDVKTNGNQVEPSECMETELLEPASVSTTTGPSFIMQESVSTLHHFITSVHTPTNSRTYNAALMKDIKLLKMHLPPGITVKCFEDRSDLFSVLIVGPPSTPYQDGLFYFDIQLPEDYPASPPLVHYYSYCSARLNPNLYEEGKVCVSLLGTWSGKGNETWTSKSTMHQLLLSIQGLILNEEPYFNEAGYEKQRGTAEGLENSRLYNEMATIKMLQSIQRMLSRPPEVFKEEVTEHFKATLPRIIERFSSWLNSEELDKKEIPTYPLFPLSKGFRATVVRVIEALKKVEVGESG